MAPASWDLFQLAPVISAAALVVATSIALGSAIIAYSSLKRVRRSQKEAQARGLFTDYQKLAMQYPIFAFPERFADRYDFANIAVNKSTEEFERYEWFISFLLVTAREILELYPDDEFWADAIRRNVGYHHKFIKWRASQSPEWLAQKGKRVEKILREVSMRQTDNADETKRSVG
jgi:hypothetical protein